MQRQTYINYSARKAMGDDNAAYATTITGIVELDGHIGAAASLQLTVFHLGAALDNGVDRHDLLQICEESAVLDTVLAKNGCLKTLGPWNPPINGDVAVLSYVDVHSDCDSTLAIMAMSDATRSFAASCGYLLSAIAPNKQGSGFKAALEEHGFFEVAPGLMGIALDYVTLPDQSP